VKFGLNKINKYKNKNVGLAVVRGANLNAQ